LPSTNAFFVCLEQHIHRLLAEDDFDNAEKAQNSLIALREDLKAFAEDGGGGGAARLKVLLAELADSEAQLCSPGARQALDRSPRAGFLLGTPFTPISLQPTALTPIPRDHARMRQLGSERTKAAAAAHRDCYGLQYLKALGDPNKSILWSDHMHQ
jgi:hypothetical protein